MHDVIFSMVTYGKGGWTWQDLYNMPVYLRNFYVKKMSDAAEKEEKALSGNNEPEGIIKGPGGLEFKRR